MYTEVVPTTVDSKLSFKIHEVSKAKDAPNLQLPKNDLGPTKNFPVLRCVENHTIST